MADDATSIMTGGLVGDAAQLITGGLVSLSPFPHGVAYRANGYQVQWGASYTVDPVLTDQDTLSGYANTQSNTASVSAIIDLGPGAGAVKYLHAVVSTYVKLFSRNIWQSSSDTITWTNRATIPSGTGLIDTTLGTAITDRYWRLCIYSDTTGDVGDPATATLYELWAADTGDIPIAGQSIVFVGSTLYYVTTSIYTDDMSVLAGVG